KGRPGQDSPSSGQGPCQVGTRPRGFKPSGSLKGTGSSTSGGQQAGSGSGPQASRRSQAGSGTEANGRSQADGHATKACGQAGSEARNPRAQARDDQVRSPRAGQLARATPEPRIPPNAGVRTIPRSERIPGASK